MIFHQPKKPATVIQALATLSFKKNGIVLNKFMSMYSRSDKVTQVIIISTNQAYRPPRPVFLFKRIPANVLLQCIIQIKLALFCCVGIAVSYVKIILRLSGRFSFFFRIQASGVMWGVLAYVFDDLNQQPENSARTSSLKWTLSSLTNFVFKNIFLNIPGISSLKS
jgi:hypothetical protein